MLSAHCTECLHVIGEPREPPFFGVCLVTLQHYYCYNCENYVDSITTARV